MLINEIFYSLQGEGHWTGTPAIFVRYAGCNLCCPFCDTDHTHGSEISTDRLISELKRYPAHRVILTGGEPSLQITPQLIGELHKSGYIIHVETNGTRPLPSGIDWVTCSPKQGAKVRLDRIDELKVVFTDTETAIESLHDIKADEYYLQPCDVGSATENRKIIEATVSYIKAHPHWRLSLQTHKLIHIP